MWNNSLACLNKLNAKNRRLTWLKSKNLTADIMFSYQKYNDYIYIKIELGHNYSDFNKNHDYLDVLSSLFKVNLNISLLKCYVVTKHITIYIHG